MRKLEIACFNPESAVIAQQGGADRVELCDTIQEGGTTPAYTITEQTRTALAIDLFVMIRPRGGNFVYSETELEQMRSDIRQFKKMGVNGFVFGVLTDNNAIDITINTELVTLASPLPCTFHRAFDEVPDVSRALEEVIECGFQTVLTSGGAKNVTEGSNTLSGLVTRAANRIVIMPGGGLRSTNIRSLMETTQAAYYHSSAITDATAVASIDEVVALKKALQ